MTKNKFKLERIITIIYIIIAIGLLIVSIIVYNNYRNKDNLKNECIEKGGTYYDGKTTCKPQLNLSIAICEKACIINDDSFSSTEELEDLFA